MHTLDCPVCEQTVDVTARRPAVRCDIVTYRDRSRRGVATRCRAPVCAECVDAARARGRWEIEHATGRLVARLPVTDDTESGRCTVCGLHVLLPGNTRRKSFVCGDRCRLGQYQTSVEKTVTRCDQCGAEFAARRGAHYCSPACRQRAYRVRGASVGKTVTVQTVDQSRIDRTKGRGQMASSPEMLRNIEGTLSGVAMACRYINPSEIEPEEVGETIHNINAHLSTIRSTTRRIGATSGPTNGPLSSQ